MGVGWARGAPNIYAMAKASDVKYGTMHGFANGDHKITLRRKVDAALGHWNSPKFGVPFNISVMDEASDFKCTKKLEFAKSNYKITPKDKNGHDPRL